MADLKKKNSAVLLGAGSATAAEGSNVGKVGIGPQVINMWTDYADPFSGAGLSVRWWATNEFDLEGGLGSSSWDEDGSEVDSDDFYLIQPLIGTEFNFSEFTEVGFNFDVGYSFTGEDDGDDSDYEYDLRGVAVGLGAHYYF